MKCQKCGANLPAGHLYCGSCGAEYQLVPDFEPELEISIAEALAGLGETVEEETPISSSAISLKGKKWSLSFFKSFWILLFSAGILSIAIYTYRSSVSYKSSQAIKAQEKGQYVEALSIYQEIRRKEPDDANWYIEEAKIQQFLGKKQEAETLGANAIKRIKNQETAYAFLLDFYVQEEQWQKIKNLLEECSYETLLEEYSLFQAEKPIFHIESGSYEGNLDVVIETDNIGDIFYTLDGTVPNENDYKYTEPIKLGNGINQIKAVFRNQYGVFSEPEERNFQISNAVPLAPVVTPESGSYGLAQMITVQIEEGTNVYYTTDISNMEQNMTLYTKPIPMPFGESSFIFVAYSEKGEAGEITWRDYILNIKMGFTMEELHSMVIQKLISIGFLLDSTGMLPSGSAWCSYVAEYPISIGEDNYYVFSEYYIEQERPTPTGTYYAVEVVTGNVYRLLQNQNGEFQLAEF